MPQPIYMVAEPSQKAALVKNGADATATDIVAHLPPYVASQYAPTGLNRSKVVRLALGVQFLAASTVRRFGTRGLAAKMEVGDWPAPQCPFFLP